MTNTSAQLKMTTLDCRDPRAAAAFWAELLGWQVVVAQDEYAMVVPPAEVGGGALGFGLVVDHEPAAWPDHGGRKQIHLDLGCDDVAATEARAVGLGAVVVDPQPGETWRVLRDPSGHLFCLTESANW